MTLAAERGSPIESTRPGENTRPGRVAHPARTDSLRAVRVWLGLVAILVLLMVVVGGATRLTGSGLSITEWRPITGALPPLSAEAWAAEFEKYRQIPQYQLLNQGMSLAQFKVIYWWEWGHRQLGRLIGVVYMLPLAWFWLSGTVRGRLALWLLAIGALGGFQGAIGWVMVASGLREGMLAVAPIKLTLHLTTACLILTALLYTLRRLTPRPAGDPAPAGAAFRSKLLLALVIVQIALGGLVAGSKAGMIYDTWPLMDGRLIPPAAHLFRETPWIENFVDNVTLVQFNHRMTAYLLLALALWHWLAVRRAAPGSRHAWGALHMVLAILVQAGVGILTLIWNVPLAMALLHQLFGVLILVSAVIHAERLGRAGEAHSAPKHQAASA